MSEVVRFAAVGDVMYGEETSVDFGIRTLSKKYGTSFPLKQVEKTLRNYDFVFGNLEVPLTDVLLNNKNPKSVKFRGLPDSVLSLKNSGFKIVSVANNHSLQFGKSGLFDSEHHLKNKNIKTVGWNDEHGKSQLEILEIKNLKIGFIAYSLIKSEEYRNDSNLLSICLSNSEKIINDVSHYASRVDHLFVSLHWGFEFVEIPSEEQVKLGRSLIDAGARGILGHHPHVLQGIEIWNSGIIAYSLGNFLFDQHFPSCMESIILEIKLNECSILDYKIIPIKSNKNFQPVIVTGNELIRISAKMKKLNDLIWEKPLTTEESYYEEIKKKVEYQKLQNIYFLKNILKVRLRFILLIIIKKIKNILSKKSYSFELQTLRRNGNYQLSNQKKQFD